MEVGDWVKVVSPIANGSYCKVGDKGTVIELLVSERFKGMIGVEIGKKYPVYGYEDRFELTDE